MLSRNRLPAIENQPVSNVKAFEQIDDAALAVIRWLNANRVEFVLVGGVARIARGASEARGPVTIVPAPYGRNLERLARALAAARARMRLDGELSGPGIDPYSAPSAPAKLSPEKLVGPERWALRCGTHDLDVEGRPAGVPRYQELLYEAAKVTLAEGVEVEVASSADIEFYDHMRRTGKPPEIRVTRAVRVES